MLASAILVPSFFISSLPAQAIDLKDVFSSASTQQGAFLPVDQAFGVSLNANNDKLTINFEITDGHYVYKDKLKLALPDGVTASNFSFDKQPTFVDDPAFGRVAVFEQNYVTATALLTNTNKKEVNDPITLTWQGCAKAGLCYPPEKTKVNINLAAVAVPEPEQEKINEIVTDEAIKPIPKTVIEVKEEAQTNKIEIKINDETDLNQPEKQQNEPVVEIDKNADDVSTISEQTVNTSTEEIKPVNSEVADATEQNEHSGINNYVLNHTPNLQDEMLKEQSMLNDPFGFARHPFLALVFIFIAGLGLALTPCVLPMLPIVANIVARQNEVNTKRSIQLSGSYALGVAVAYGILGAIIAYIGESVGLIGWLQNPVILLVFVAIFVVLGLYMLELVNFRIPASISQFLNKLSQAGNNRLGSISGSFLVGLLSALVVSPCVSAPLSGVLVAVAAMGNVLLGFLALFVLGLGLTLPLVIFAGTQGKFMPKAGEWMNWIKQGFAYLMFAVALLILERIFVSPIMLLLWAAWFSVIAFWLWTWKGKLQMLTQTFAMVMVLWAVALVFGASQGNTNSWQPLRGVFKKEQVTYSTIKITSVDQLDEVLTHNPKVLVDLYADWCIECKIMEKNLFTQPPKQLEEWQVVKFDITDTTDDSKAILSRYNLFGPPALIYYVEGQLVTVQVGEVKRDMFENGLKAITQMADAE